MKHDLFVAGEDVYHTYRIPSLNVTANGVVLAFCEGRRHNRGDSGDIDLVLKRSLDGGCRPGRRHTPAWRFCPKV